MGSSLFKGRLSQREQRLAAAVGIVLFVRAIFSQIVMPIMNKWQLQGDRMRAKIAQIEFLGQVIEMEESVTAKYDMYRGLLAQERSDEAVRDELMQDINAIATRSKVKADAIRPTPTDSAADYNRYVVEIEVEGPPASLASFLANLQASKKLFRVESLNVSRRTETGRRISGTMQVSRILVHSGGEQMPETEGPAAITAMHEDADKNLIVNGDMGVWSIGWGRDRYPDSWSGKGITTARSNEHAVRGTAAARVAGRSARSTFYQDVKVEPGSRYRLTAHMAAISGAVSLRLQDVESRKYYGEGEDEPVPVKGGAMSEYVRELTTLGDPGGGKRTLRVMVFFPKGKEAVYVDDVRLVKLGADEEATEEK
jgi:Tfp pilus assembly protein PilO